MKKEYCVLGGMAGSSMDGLDLALISFQQNEDKWKFRVVRSGTVSYPKRLFDQLSQSSKMSAEEQKSLDVDYGEWIGEQVNQFLKDSQLPELLAIHGHTIIHEPENGVSWQLGSGEKIAAITGITAITDFRSLDVKIGGQGAPLVPLGDFELFSDYDACLNLGGIANISLKELKIAGDICPCNQVLNYYANQLGFAFDDKGNLARKGSIDTDFLVKLNSNTFYKKPFPKSLPNQFISNEILDFTLPENGLRTYSEFITDQISASLKNLKQGDKKLLVTGGGAYNSFLMELIQRKLSDWEVVTPHEEIISFKEAIIFGFLGMKKYLGEVNVLRSVTGASHDTSSGVIHLPK